MGELRTVQSKAEHKYNRIKALHAKDYLRHRVEGREGSLEVGCTSEKRKMVTRKIVNSLDVAHSG